ncbi:Sugar transporter STL1 [Colletotrichum sp. SAR11_240]|nr:Sugar transporter STL1 [Colletotrichum sp. SAR11_240]
MFFTLGRVNFFFGDILGRRRAIWLAMGLVVIGATLQTTAFHVPHLIIGRVITGLGTGIKTSTVPMYQAELCDHTTRGRLVSAEVLFVGVGIVIAYWFDFGMSFIGGAIAWRLPIAFQMVFALVVIVLMFALPESPHWLFNHGREAEAVDVLCKIYDMKPTNDHIIRERTAIIQAIGYKGAGNTSKSLFNIFRNDEVRTGYRVLLAWGIQFMNQAGGINLVVYYIPSVLVQNIGTATRTAQILGGCINMMFMFGSILPSLALDRMGRRKTMISGCLGLSICMLLVAALLSQVERPNGHVFATASIAFFF